MEFFDALETRDPVLREREQFAALRQQIAHAQKHAPYFGALLAGVDPASVRDRAALAQLPVTRKSELTDLQKASLPFAQMVTRPVGELSRVYMSPGPTFDPEAASTDYWRFGRAMFAPAKLESRPRLGVLFCSRKALEMGAPDQRRSPFLANANQQLKSDVNRAWCNR